MERYLNYVVPESNRKLLLQILLDVTNILSVNKITYWVDGGTLLSCVRHHGQILHDDDVDIGVDYKDYFKITKNLFHDIKSKGYSIEYEPKKEVIKVFI